MKQVLIPSLLCFLIIFGCALPQAVCQQEPARPKPVSYIFEITDASACWRSEPSDTTRLIIRNKTACDFMLTIGGGDNDTLHVTGNGRTLPIAEQDADKIVLSGGRTLPVPKASGMAIKIIWVAVSCPDPKEKTTNVLPCVSTQGRPAVQPAPTVSVYYFIPSPAEEAEYRARSAKAGADADDCCPGSLELVFDYKAQCLVPTCDLEDCICRKCREHNTQADSCATCRHNYRCPHRQNVLRRFHPRVDDNLRIRVTGLHPYRDSFEVNASFANRNQEDKKSFTAYLYQDKKEPEDSDPKADGDKANAQAADSNKNKKGLELIPEFRDEMRQFYQEKLLIEDLSSGFLSLCISHIQNNIELRFEITAATPERITDKVNEWLDADTIMKAAEKTMIRTQLKEGLRNYQRILNYRTASAWLFQVKNYDVTTLSFQAYRDGKPVSAKPQTFDLFNKGGFTINYSTGIAINGLVNHAFTTTPLDTIDAMGQPVTKLRVIRQRSSNINIGPVVFAHAYYRYPAWNRFKFGATTGFMASNRENDLALTFLFGGSVLLGSEERLVLTGGGVLGKVDRLGEGLNAGEQGTLLDPPDSPGETTSVTTRAVYRCKWFVGVTYNLGK